MKICAACFRRGNTLSFFFASSRKPSLKVEAAVHPRLASWITVRSLFLKGRSVYEQSGDKNIIDFTVCESTT